jgi:hypothetical protein
MDVSDVADPDAGPVILFAGAGAARDAISVSRYRESRERACDYASEATSAIRAAPTGPTGVTLRLSAPADI